MFDRTKPHVLFLTDVSDTIYLERSLGPNKVGSVLKQHGIESFVLHFLSAFTVSEIKLILNSFINENTIFVGVNNFNYNIWYMNEIHYDKMIPDTAKYVKELKGTILPHGNQFNNDIKKIIKEKNPNCKLVLGGPNAVDLEENKIFDFVVSGYSEMSIVDLTNHLLYNTKLKKAHKSVFGFTVIKDTTAEGYDFVNHVMHYTDDNCILENETLLLEFSRGCIFRCKFCSFPMNGKKKMDYIRDTDLLYEELISNYEKFNVTRYLLVDDTFNDSVEKCESILKLSKRLPFNLEYWAYIRLDLLTAHPKTIDLLYQSGLRAAYYGIETLNQEASQFLNKGGNRKKLIQTINDIKSRYGNNFSQHGSFIYGLPKESFKSLQETTNWLLSDDNNLDTYEVAPLFIRDDKLRNASPFVSDIDLNYSEYGYTSPAGGDKILYWENEHTSWFEILQHISSMGGKRVKRNVIDGRRALILSRYGNDLNKWINKELKSDDIEKLDQLKMNSINQYKQLVSSTLNIQFAVNHQFKSYTDFYVNLHNR